jgi:hypothetical protein
MLSEKLRVFAAEGEIPEDRSWGMGRLCGAGRSEAAGNTHVRSRDLPGYAHWAAYSLNRPPNGTIGTFSMESLAQP